MKNVIIGILVIMALTEGYFLMMKKSAPTALGAATATIATTPSPQTSGGPRPSGFPGGRPPAPLARGDKFVGSAVEKFAHLIAPGTISADSQQYLTGFAVKSTSLEGGDTQVDLVPKDSDDQFQSYVLKPGDSLYFVEMTPVDDKADKDVDANYRDDYGIVVNSQGIVQ